VSIVIDERQDGIVVINWSERTVLDASNANDLRSVVGEVERKCCRLVLDMSHIDFIDSSIIGALVGFLRRTRAAGGDTKLVGLTPDIETIFELTRLQRVFRIHSSITAAVQDFDVPAT
jgi:anti-anti-sigma factor